MQLCSHAHTRYIFCTLEYGVKSPQKMPSDYKAGNQSSDPCTSALRHSTAVSVQGLCITVSVLEKVSKHMVLNFKDLT